MTAAQTAFRDWRADPSVTRAPVTSLEVFSDEPIPGILDGESIVLGTRETVRALRDAVRVLRPADEAAARGT